MHIIGGGMSGMLMGYYLKQKGIDFTLYEIKSKIGGLLQTVQTPYGIAEAAANGFVWNQEMQQICDTLKVKIIAADAAAKKRFFYTKGSLKTQPVSKLALLNALRKMVFNPHKKFETVLDFAQYYLDDEATYHLLEPALGGIYAAPIKDLSFALVMSFINQNKNIGRQLIQKAMSMSAESKGTQGFDGGWATFNKAMVSYLKAHIKFNASVPSIALNENYIFTTPAHITKNYFTQVATTCHALSMIKYQKTLSVTLFYNKSQLSSMPIGFGCLVPRSEKMASLGVLFNHCIFPANYTKNYASFTFIINPDFYHIYKNYNDSELTTKLNDELKLIIKLPLTPSLCKRFEHDNGIPLYAPHLENQLSQLRKDFFYMNGFAIFGNYTGAISIRNMAESARLFVASNF